jgi:DNA-binding CsgD family transcriptional regulator
VTDVVERAAQLARLRRLVDDVDGGRGGAALISGPFGCGKTDLLRRLESLAEEAGVRHVGTVAARAERSLPFGVIRHLLLGAVPDPDPGRARRVERLLGDTATSISTSLLDGLCNELTALAADGPVLLAVDDVHDADEPSLACLSHLVRRLAGARVGLALTASPSGRHTPRLLIAELRRQPNFRHLPIGPLSVRGVAELAGAVQHDRGPADGFAAACYATTGGNPRLVQAMIEDRRGGRDGVTQDGPAFAQSALSLLHRDDHDLLRVTRGVAVLDDHATPHALAHLLELRPEVVDEVLAELAAAGLVDGHRLRHPRLGQIALDGLPTAERTVLHRAAARLLYEEGGAPEAVARHLAAAGGVNEGWAVTVLLEAAERALDAGERGTGLSFLRVAGQVCADEHQRAGIRSRLVRAAWRADPSTAVRFLPALTTHLDQGQLTGRNAVLPVKSLLWYGRFDEALQLLRRLAGSHPAPDADTTASLIAVRCWMSYTFPVLYRRVVAEGLLPDPRPALGGTAGLQLDASSALARALAGPDDEHDAARIAADAERVLQRCRLDETTHGTLSEALAALVFAGHHTRAAAWADQLHAHAVQQRAPMWAGMIDAIRAFVHLRTGQPGAAAARARSALTQIRAEGWGIALGLPVSALVLAETELGRHEEAARALEPAIPDGMAESFIGPLYLYARGRHHLATGAARAALNDLEQCGEQLVEWRLDGPGFVPWRAAAEQARRELPDDPADRPAFSRRIVSPFHPVVGATARRAVELSDAEYRVAVLAAGGHTNREIAGRLYVTMSTVEQHLTRVYRKLRVSRRADLPAALPAGNGGRIRDLPVR